MPSAGELLRSERIRQNKTLSEIADQTRISVRYLQAIESDNVEQLPGEFFYKAFLRQYSQALSLDEPATRQVMSSAAPSETPDPVPVLNEIYTQSRAGESSAWRPSTGVAVGVLVVVLAGGAALYAWYQNWQTQQEARAASERAAAASAPGPAPQQQPALPAPAEVSPAPAAAATPALPPGQMALQLKSTAPAWVQVTSGGENVFTGTVQPDTVKEMTLSGETKLLTGNAGALNITLNGKELESIGPAGQVRTVVFSDGNYQILQPRPRTSPPASTANPSPVSTQPAP